MDGYKQFDVVIEGDVLLMHNGQTADPMNRFAKAMSAITKDRNRKNTEEGRETLARIEYEAGLYLNGKGEVVIPSRILEAHLCEAARKTKQGKQALAGLFVDTDATFEYAGGPMKVSELIESDDHRFVASVSVGQGKVTRVRPIFRNWRASFRVSLLAEQADGDSLKAWLRNGGALVGLGDFRPRYGRYNVVSCDEVQEKHAAKKAA